jgi:hypothetical protein
VRRTCGPQRMGHPHFLSGMNVRVEVLSPALCGGSRSGRVKTDTRPQRMGHPRCREDRNQQGEFATPSVYGGA